MTSKNAIPDNYHRCVFYGDLYPNNECYDPRIGPKLELLIQARKNFAYGSTTDYFQYKDCIGWVRSGDVRSGYLGCAVVVRSSVGSGEAMRWVCFERDLFLLLNKEKQFFLWFLSLSLSLMNFLSRVGHFSDTNLPRVYLPTF